MKEYIEKAAALDICQKEYEERLRMADYCGDTVAWNIGGAIKNTPAADVVEVRHGRWLKRSDGTPYCSNCGANERDTYSSVVNECAFCYSCGARMDKEDEHEAD